MSSSIIHTPVSVSGSLPPSFFSCRIVKIDFYMSSPIKDLDICYSQFRSSAIEKVPVIRIFGAAPSGQKTCLHVHGSFPYLYVPCVVVDPKEQEAYLQQLCGSIDHALQVSLGAGSRPAHHVFKAVVVKGIPFYGYHKSEELFVKLYLYNPMLIKRLSDLLLAGAVMNTSFQPHEAHIPFPLQFMMDHNLYGMNYIHLALVKFRIIGGEPPACTTPHSSQSRTSPLSPQSPSSHLSLLYNPSETHWDMENLSSDLIVGTPRESVCELEVDALAADILNRHELTLVSGGYPGLTAIWEEERQRRTALGIEVPLSPPPSPERREDTVHSAEAKHRAHFEQILQERLGKSPRDSSTSTPDESTSLSENDHLVNCTQSCDPDLHLPDQSDRNVPDKRTDQQSVDVIVDTAAIEQSMELTQKLSATSISKSTDVELMNLMLELCETPIHNTQCTRETQSVGFSQNVGQALTRKMERGHSVFSEHSLFSNSPSPHSGSPKHTQAEAVLAHEDSVTRLLADSGDATLDRRAIAPVHSTSVSSIGLVLDSSLDTSIDEAHSEDGMGSTQADPAVFNETKQQGDDANESADLELVDELPQPSSQARLDKSLEQGKWSQNVYNQSDLVPELDFTIPSSRLSSPLPLTPEAKELQDLVAESFESHQLSQDKSSRAGSADFESDDDDIPCAQVSHPQFLQTASSQREVGLSDVDPNWNSVLSVSLHSSGKSVDKSAGDTNSNSDGVQLEFDMPEIELVHSRASEDSVLYDISVQSQKKPNTDAFSQADKSIPASAIRSHLLRMCSECNFVDCEGSEDVSLVEDVKRERSDSEAEEIYWSSQFWDDFSVQCDNTASTSLDFHASQSVGDTEDKSSDDIIPQLDGRSDSPKSSTRSKSKRKTLGTRRKKITQPKDPPKIDKDSSVLTASKESGVSTIQRKRVADGTQLKETHQKKVSSKKGRTALTTGNDSDAELTPKSRGSKGKTHWKKDLNTGFGSPSSKQSLLATRTKSEHSQGAKSIKKSRPRLSLRKRRQSELRSSLKLQNTDDLKIKALANNFSLKLERAPLAADASDEKERLQRKRTKSNQDQTKKKRAKLTAKNRSERYGTRYGSRGNRLMNYSGRYSLLSFERQLKEAIKLSLKSSSPESVADTIVSSCHLAEESSLKSPRSDSSGVDLNTTVSSCHLAEESSLKSSRSDSSGVDLDTIISSCHLAEESSLKSPHSDSSGVDLDTIVSSCHLAEESSLKSPHSDSSGVDLNRTIIEESPLRENTPQITQSPSMDSQQAGSKEVLQNDSVPENDMDILNTSFCSIPESPPFTSSPVSRDFSLQLHTDTDAHRSSPPLGSPIHSSSQCKEAETKESNKAPKSENFIADQELVESASDVPVLKERSFDFASYIVGLSSPEKAVSDTELPYTTQSTCSEEPQNVSSDDFHLAVTSESEEELQEEREVSESLDMSSGHECFRSNVTLKREPEGNMLKIQMDVEDPNYLRNSDTQCDEIARQSQSELARSLPPVAIIPDPVADFSGTSGEPKLDNAVMVTPATAAPTAQYLMSTLSAYGLPSERHEKPFCGHPEDVQQPKEIGGRILRVPSKMAYELKEFKPTYSRVSHSVNGLQQMRLVVSMLMGSLLETQLQQVPPCHPSTEGMSKLACYTVDDFKQDVVHRASCLPYQQVVVSPVIPAPSAAKIESTFRELLSVDKATKKDCVKVGNSEVVEPKHTEDWNISAESAMVTSVTEPANSQSLGSGQTPVALRASIQSSTCLLSSTPQVREGEDVTRLRDDPKGEKVEGEAMNTPTRKRRYGKKRSNELPFTPISSGKRETSQLEGPTPNNTYGFRVSQSALPAKSDSHQVQYLTCMSIEVHVRTRGSLKPDPDMDPILALFYFVHNDWPLQHHDCPPESNTRLGVIAIDVTEQTTEGHSRSPLKQSNIDLPEFSGTSYLDNCGLSPELEVLYVSSELELLDKLVSLVRETDPDIIVGYEVAMLSWGYCIERAAHLNVNLASKLSRMPNSPVVKQQGGTGENPWFGSGGGVVQLVGRITLNVWRLMRLEVSLNVYSFENVVYHVLHQRLPLFSFRTLASWYDHPTKLYRYRVVEYYVKRCQGNFQLLDCFNLIGRTSEFARLYGMEFENVLDRGTQYRVESMMLRLVKPANYIAVSPSIQQRARMAAPECLPLILEPESKFYVDPVVVLDFQSLYPSMVIGYNYCYSTCLGRVQNLSQFGDFTLGATSLNVPNQTLKKLRDSIHISPNGVVFVKSHIRQGIMPRMLKDILGTRIMVKSSMKQHKANKSLNRMLDARQLGLKLIANVTYGYTAANFSGRMPCVEVADSIVRKGRETLERAIELVNSTPEWGGRVVYGDTDSLFVLLEGASKEEAFRIGKEITERVTADNPPPIKLKFEKVYMPCILQTKKRYVGYMYETLDQSEPVFDAKGIETVRRDGCPAVTKILEKSLKTLFSTRDLSLVKQYVQRQCGKLLEGRGDLQEYMFAKEYRGREYYRPGACVPALELAKRSLLVDRRSEPRPGERVPYVIVYGTPGQPLIQLAKKPEELLNNPGLRLNGVYYITKQVLPALDRAFSLLGVDVRQWYDEMPRVLRAPTTSDSTKRARGTLGQYFSTIHCPVCHQLTVEGVCAKCKTEPQKVAITLSVKIHNKERNYSDLSNLCRSCVGSQDSAYFNRCISFDCPVVYRRSKAENEVASCENTRTQIHESLLF